MPDWGQVRPPDTSNLHMILGDLLRQAQLKQANEQYEQRQLEDAQSRASLGATPAEIATYAPEHQAKLEQAKSPDEMNRVLRAASAVVQVRKQRVAAIEQARAAAGEAAKVPGGNTNDAVAEHQRLLTSPIEGGGQLPPEMTGGLQSELSTTIAGSSAQRQSIEEERSARVAIAGQESEARAKAETAALPERLKLEEASSARRTAQAKTAQLDADLTTRYRDDAQKYAIPLEYADDPKRRPLIDEARFSAQLRGTDEKVRGEQLAANTKLLDWLESQRKGKTDKTVSTDSASLATLARNAAGFAQANGATLVPSIVPIDKGGWFSGPTMQVVLVPQEVARAAIGQTHQAAAGGNAKAQAAMGLYEEIAKDNEPMRNALHGRLTPEAAQDAKGALDAVTTAGPTGAGAAAVSGAPAKKLSAKELGAAAGEEETVPGVAKPGPSRPLGTSTSEPQGDLPQTLVGFLSKRFPNMRSNTQSDVAKRLIGDLSDDEKAQITAAADDPKKLRATLRELLGVERVRKVAGYALKGGK